MKLEGLSYEDTCKIIQKVGAVYSGGFHPWVPFVRSDKCKLIRVEDHGRTYRQNIDARSISTYQDCVDIQLSDSLEELGSSGRIILELMEYPGDSLYGRRDGPIRARYVFEVLEADPVVTRAVERGLAFYIRQKVDDAETARKRRIRARIEKKVLEEIGIC